MENLRTIALIGTGGTIAAVGRDALDLIDYDANGLMLDSARLIGLLPKLPPGVQVLPVAMEPVASTEVYFDVWKKLVKMGHSLLDHVPDLAGLVIAHGTATLEETAYFLHLTLKLPIPVVLVGAQRPSNALSSDAGLNLYNALRVAADSRSVGLGVVVVMNDEIHAAREVSKTSTYRLQAFQSRDMGMLGYCDRDAVTYYRKPARAGGADAEFDISNIESLPNVGIAYSYAGSNGGTIRALQAEGSDGIVVAAFAPGCFTRHELAAIHDAVAAGIFVVVSTRAGSGRVGDACALKADGLVSGDNLTPQKARLLLALALTMTRNRDDIERIFRTY